MARLQINLFRLRSHLQRGGVIAYPTESSFGLGCLPHSAKGIARILRLKKRPQHKGLIVIGKDWAQLQQYVFRLPEKDVAQLNWAWQHAVPTTFVLPAKPLVLANLRGQRRTQLAVRVPQHDLARRLCDNVNSSLISTSCNRAKRRPCKTTREVWRQFGRQVLIVRGRVGGRKQPSEIIDWGTNARLR